MSGLCGWFSRRTSETCAEVVANVGAHLRRFDHAPIRSAYAPFGAVAVAASHGEADVWHDANRLVAVWGRAWYTDQDTAGPARRPATARLLADDYSRNGCAVLRSLRGSFAVAIVNARHEEVLIAVDRMGSYPLYYGTTADGIAFGSKLDAVAACPGMSVTLDSQALFDYVHFHMVPAPRTVQADRRRLLPGTFLLWKNGAVRSEPYWEMRFIEDRDTPWPALKETFVSLLRQSIRARSDGSVGAFLSGGTDSSTIAGLLTDTTAEPVKTFSIGFEAEGYDEMPYARLAARHFGTRHHEYYVSPDDVVRAIPQIAAVHDQPFGNASAIPTYYCAKLAREHGVEVLLGGDGGDELFGGNDRYAKQYLYSLYSDLPAGLRKGLIEPIAFLPPEVGFIGQVQRYIRNASIPMPARYDNYNLLQRLGPANVFTREFLETVDVGHPHGLVSHAYERAHAGSLIDRMLALDLRFTLADNDLPKVVRSCELAGVGVRFPMLDDALVAFSAELPPRLKLNKTKLRYFFKEALRGYLPAEIIAKTKHGFGLPFGVWLERHSGMQQIALDSLSDLKGRHIVRSDFIDTLISTHLKTHAPYYGTMVWLLMMLEQWFAQRTARFSSAGNTSSTLMA